MKHLIEFDLPEDQWAFDTCLNAFKNQAVIEEFDSWLRAIIKYEIVDEFSKKEHETLQKVRDKFNEMMKNEDN